MNGGVHQGEKKLVYISSPYRGDIEGNIKRVHRIANIYYDMGYIPIVPHFFTGFLEPDQFEEGMEICLAVLKRVDELHYFGQPTEGMQMEIELARELGIPIVEKEREWGR